MTCDTAPQGYKAVRNTQSRLSMRALTQASKITTGVRQQHPGCCIVGWQSATAEVSSQPHFFRATATHSQLNNLRTPSSNTITQRYQLLSGVASCTPLLLQRSLVSCVQWLLNRIKRHICCTSSNSTTRHTRGLRYTERIRLLLPLWLVVERECAAGATSCVCVCVCCCSCSSRSGGGSNRLQLIASVCVPA